MADCQPSNATPPAPSAFRFVHVSDMHVEPDAPGRPARRSAEGLAAALRSIMALDPAPEFLITGGDHIMDALERTAPDVEAQWALYRRTLAAGTSLPVRPVIGNHDVFGWMTDAVTPETPGYGKALAMESLGMPSPYYSFDHRGWHFVVLDNTQPGGRGYYGGIDPPQMEWLAGDLARVPAGVPVIVVTHIPILCVCAQHFFPESSSETFWNIPDVFVQTESQPVVDLLRRFNVRLCLSAHIHMVDRVEFRGITFICDGSVSADWWRGPFRGFPEGYGVLDLRPDGTFTHEYRPYGWTAK